MKPEIVVLTERRFKCPECGAVWGSKFDHLEVGRQWGPWYCDGCGVGVQGVVTDDGVDVEYVTSAAAGQRKIKTLDLVRLDDPRPVYAVVRSIHFPIHGEIDKDYFYGEHTCPTNFLRDIEVIAVDGDTDPHGIFQWVRSVVSTGEETDAEIAAIFPEVNAHPVSGVPVVSEDGGANQ